MPHLDEAGEGVLEKGDEAEEPHPRRRLLDVGPGDDAGHLAEGGDEDPVPAREVRQTLVEGRPGRIRVSIKTLSGQLYKPSVDLAFSSAAEVLGGRVLAIVMTGMGADGSLGARDLKSLGARIWTQSEESCVVYGMPREAVALDAIDQVLPLDQIAPALDRMTKSQKGDVQ